MDFESIKTANGKAKCIECGNEFDVEAGKQVGDVVECPACGIEYEIAEIDAEGNYTLKLIEEEK